MCHQVGPFGQTASALLLAGSAASSRMDFAHYMKGKFLGSTSGMTVSSAGTLLDLLLLGHDFFWIVVAFHGIIKGICYHQHSYGLIWWATIFPLGKAQPNRSDKGNDQLTHWTATTNTAFISLSINMDSPTFRALSAIFTILLTILYLGVCVRYLYSKLFELTCF